MSIVKIIKSIFLFPFYVYKIYVNLNQLRINLRGDVTDINHKLEHIFNRLDNLPYNSFLILKGIDINYVSISILKQMHHIVSNITSDSIIIDCGSNCGYFSNFFLKLGATIYAFEPNKYISEKNKEMHKDYIKQRKLFVYDKAVYIKNDVMKFYFKKGDDLYHVGSSLINHQEYAIQETAIDVEVVNIIEFIRNLGKRITILKLDVEGVEYEILDALIDTDTYLLIDYIVAELHDELLGVKNPEEKKSNLRKKIADKKITNINLDWI